LSYHCVEELRQAAARGIPLEFCFFWGHRLRKDGRIGPPCLSQWFAAPFELDGVEYPTAEHYMMAQKASLFGDEEARERILRCKEAGKAKAIGRGVRGFEEARWVQEREGIVRRGSHAKFAQNPPLRYFLLSTRDKVLAEASPHDAVWGIGLAADHADARHPDRWPGRNLLGFVLMSVRDDFARSR
jgi:ribA/ribD-fused uncharacterized protein